MKAQSGGSGRIVVRGSVDFYSAVAFRERVVRKLLDADWTDLVIDFESVDYLSFEGLGVLLDIQRRADENGTAIRVLGAHGQPADVIELAGLSALLTDAAAPTRASA